MSKMTDKSIKICFCDRDYTNPHSDEFCNLCSRCIAIETIKFLYPNIINRIRFLTLNNIPYKYFTKKFVCNWNGPLSEQLFLHYEISDKNHWIIIREKIQKYLYHISYEHIMPYYFLLKEICACLLPEIICIITKYMFGPKNILSLLDRDPMIRMRLSLQTHFPENNKLWS